MEKKLLNKKKTAERYGVSVMTIDYWEKKKGFPVIRKGKIKKPLYDPEKCDIWVYGDKAEMPKED